jgi:ATPase family associated with various cellular activities (AAA)
MVKPRYFLPYRMSNMLLPLLMVNMIGQIISHIPWAAMLIILKPLGLRLYYLKKRDECTRIQKRLQNNCSHTTDGGKGYGYSIGYWYVASISINEGECGENYSVLLFATESSYKALTKDIDTLSNIDDSSLLGQQKQLKKIGVYERTGSYANPWFRRRERDANYEPTETQSVIIEQIKENQKKKRHSVIYLHGPPSTGKSMIGVLLANEFGSSFCNTLKPWQPGDSLGILHTEIEPTPTKPLIIVFDEIDSVLIKIHKDNIAPHKNISTAVSDKPGWNHMLDEIQRGMYPDMILILTSNRDPDYINGLDPSYLREGRVDMKFHLTEKIVDVC